jgi:hypothetical protein
LFLAVGCPELFLSSIISDGVLLSSRTANSVHIFLLSSSMSSFDYQYGYRNMFGSRYFGLRNPMLEDAATHDPPGAFFVMHEELRQLHEHKSAKRNTRRRFAAYPSKEAFWSELAKVSPGSRSFYEIMLPDRPVPLYFDVEWTSAAAGGDQKDVQLRMDSLMAHIGRALHTVTRGVFPESKELQEEDIVVTCGSRNIQKAQTTLWKNSFHLRLVHVFFETNHTAMKLFVQFLLASCMQSDERMWYQKQEQRTCIVDTLVYSRYRSMRLAGCIKAAEPDSKLVVTSDHGELDAYLTDCTIGDGGEDILLTAADVEAVMAKVEHKHAPAAARQQQQQRRQQQRGIKVVRHAEDEQRVRVAGLLEAMLRRHGDEASTVRAEPVHNKGANIFAGRNGHGGQPRKCPWGRVHESNNFYFRIEDGGDAYYHCFGSGCQSKEGAWYGRLYQDEFELLLSGDAKDLGIAALEVYNKPVVRPYERAKTNVLLVKSGMCTQKSQAMKRMIAAIDRGMEGKSSGRGRSEPKPWRMVAIGTRVAFDHTLLGLLHEFGFVLYSQLTAAQLRQQSRVIVQYESLHKLIGNEGEGGGGLLFDVVLLDEIESLLSNCASPMNRNHQQNNGQVFEMLLRHAQRVVAMDADLSHKTLSVMKQIVGGDNITLHINQHAALERTVVFHRTVDCWKQRIAWDVRETEDRVVICTASKHEGEEIETEILRPSKCGYKFYHSDCSDWLREDFLNLNGAWQQEVARVPMFTPTVTVGASFDVPDWIQRVYVYGTPRSVTPRVVMQMAGRVRYPMDKHLHCFLNAKQQGGGGAGTPSLTLQQVKDEFAKHRGIVHDEQGKVHLLEGKLVLDEASQQYQWRLMPSWMNEAYAFDTLERNLAQADYAGQFQRRARLNGYNMEPCTCKDSEQKENEKQQEAENESKDDKEEKEEDQKTPKAVFDATPLLTPEEAEALELKKQQHCASAAEKVALNKYHHQRWFESLIDFDHWHSTHWHMGHICNVAACVRLVSDENLMKNDERKHLGSYVENASVMFTKNRLIRELLVGILGLQTPLDTETNVTRERILEKQAPFAKLYVDKLQPEFQLHPRSAAEAKHLAEAGADRKEENESEGKESKALGAGFKKLIGAINRVLRAWGFAELQKQKRVRPRGAAGKRQETTGYYKLQFCKVLSRGEQELTVLDLAKDSRFFVLM